MDSTILYADVVDSGPFWHVQVLQRLRIQEQGYS